MHPVKQWLIGIGIVVACLGWECLPHGQSLLPNHFLSLFAKSSDTGAFIPFGTVLLIVGACLLLAGLLLPIR